MLLIWSRSRPPEGARGLSVPFRTPVMGGMSPASEYELPGPAESGNRDTEVPGEANAVGAGPHSEGEPRARGSGSTLHLNSSRTIRNNRPFWLAFTPTPPPDAESQREEAETGHEARHQSSDVGGFMSLSGLMAIPTGDYARTLDDEG